MLFSSNGLNKIKRLSISNGGILSLLKANCLLTSVIGYLDYGRENIANDRLMMWTVSTESSANSNRWKHLKTKANLKTTYFVTSLNLLFFYIYNTSDMINPCPAESGYTLPLQTV